jgi:pyruvate dehydrogenase E2 component (dihydrolipoamide acetyltransferase)
LAKDAGIDLAGVTGTGPNGRITEDDVRRAIAAGAHSDVEVVPLQGVRGVIARRMTESLQTMAQLTLHTEADMTALNERRARQAGDAAPSVTELLIRATVIALQAHPAVNATIEDGEIRRHRVIGLGVATHTDRGLIVPVLKDAAALSVQGIRDRLRELVGEVRAATAKSADLEGGTFTITNLGPFGIDAFTPIIQPPQIAILGVGRIRGCYIRGSGGPEWHEFMSLSLTFDHRALDGVPAANFLAAIVGALETANALFR